MKTVLVTGNAGFIGHHLANALLERGFEVRGIDNLAGGRRELVDPRVKFHEADIRNFEEIAPIFRGVDWVFHVAALPRVQPSILDPRATHEVNVTGTLNVLVAARDAGVQRVIYSASSSAYGDQERLPLTEDMEARPQSPYGLQKYMGELQCRLFSEVYGMGTISLRYFNVYGPDAPTSGAYALVVGKFLDQRKRNEPLTIVPDGKQTRDFTHVRDVVRANILAAQSDAVVKGEVINIGGGHNRSVLEIAELVGGPTVLIEARKEPKHTLADISKAIKLLGWEPEIKFEDGIAELKKIAEVL